MSKTTTDPSKYYRTGIAITNERKVILDERLNALGLKSLGDLVLLFILADNMTETLKPLVASYNEKRAKQKLSSPYQKTLVNKLKGMSKEDIAALLKAAGVSSEAV